MSYTLRGRLETRVAALVVPVVAALAIHAWWAIELAGLMAAVGLAFDLCYHRPLAYQPGWAAVPLGLLELGVLMLLVRVLGVAASPRDALLFFAGAWLWAQLLAHALLPVLRMSWSEDGGELGARSAGTAALALALPFVGAGAVYVHDLPPVVHLSAGVHQGPIYVRRRERLVGDPGAVVRGGIVVLHRDVTVQNVRVVGGDYGIAVLGVRDVTLSHVTVEHARLDGIHVRHASVLVSHCTVDERGVPEGQGIDVSYGLIQGESMISHCAVTGGRDGIVVHGSMAMIEHNHVAATRMTGISLTEMSMGSLAHNTVDDALGVGLLCGDHSMCDVDRNLVRGTRRDDWTGNTMRAGIGLEVEFGAQADVGRNDLSANPRHVGVFLDSSIVWR